MHGSCNELDVVYCPVLVNVGLKQEIVDLMEFRQVISLINQKKRQKNLFSLY